MKITIGIAPSMLIFADKSTVGVDHACCVDHDSRVYAGAPGADPKASRSTQSALIGAVAFAFCGRQGYIISILLGLDHFLP